MSFFIIRKNDDRKVINLIIKLLFKQLRHNVSGSIFLPQRMEFSKNIHRKIIPQAKLIF